MQDRRRRRLHATIEEFGTDPAPIARLADGAATAPPRITATPLAPEDGMQVTPMLPTDVASGGPGPVGRPAGEASAEWVRDGDPVLGPEVTGSGWTSLHHGEPMETA